MAKAKAKGRKLTTSYGQRATAVETLIQRSRGGSAALASKGVDASKTRGLTSKSQNRSDYRNGLLELAGGQRINNANANPASRARERVRMSIEAAPLNRGLSASQKSDYAKATQAHKAAAEKRASNKPASDGMTDAYVRTQNGKTVQVGGYRTVLPK